MDARSLDEVVDKVMEFSDGSVAEGVINDYLYSEGAELIKKGVTELLPVSGRTWKGKRAPAKVANPFRKKRESNLSITVHAPGHYHYLYFPDDGSNTIHHCGNQQFMFFGADRKSEEIGNNIVNKLVEKMEG